MKCFPFCVKQEENEEDSKDKIPSLSLVINNEINSESGSEVISTGDGSTSKDMPERGKWSGNLDFIFGCISYAVGLGNVWRFPYLCYENGGGAFLIPYAFCIIFCGIPLFLLEVSVGQYLSSGGIGVWNLVPIMKGIGFASMTMIGLCNIYYIVLIAYTLFYFVASFNNPLPWEKCGNEWNTVLCINSRNVTNDNISTSNFTSPVKEYWEHHVLQITTGLHDLGGLRLELALYLLLAWFLVYIVIWRGIHQSGKIIWFTALFPYVILLILFGRGVTLEGASTGLLYFIKPNWEKLQEPKVWVAAGTQVLFSYGIGIGANIALGSYNRYRHNFYRDSLIVCCISSGTSLFSGLVIFSVLGHMAFLQNKDVSQVARSGPGLAFLAYPEVVVRLPLSPLWAVLFFLMLIILGTDSQFCTVESFVTGIVDEFATVLRPRRRLFTLAIVVIQFLLGLPLVTQGGMYLFQLMDFYSASGATLLTVVFFEIVGLSWVYGAKTLYNNMEDMLGFKPNYYFFVCWVFFAPALVLGIFLFSVIQHEPLTYADSYTYPWWGEMMGWGMALASIIWIPVYAIYYIYKTPGNLKERFIIGITPSVQPYKVDRSPSTEEGTPLDISALPMPIVNLSVNDKF